MIRAAESLSMALVAVVVIAGCANHSPELFPIPNRTVRTGAVLEFDIKAVDDDADRLNFDIQAKPASAVFQQVDNNSARFQWTPINSDAGPRGEGLDYTVTFLVTDGIDTATESIIIRVTLGETASGSPVFITPADYTLDLDRNDEIRFNVEVRDPDSESVQLRLLEEIPGADFFAESGAKIAAFRWRPAPEQISDRPVWGLRVGARDDTNEEVFQDITILIRGGQKKCAGTPPAVEHDALPDQNSADPYGVTATVTDAESDIDSVTLYWLVDTGGGNSGSFQKKYMTRDGNDWEEAIPNPGLAPGETATISYYICAIDNDDAGGTECDLRGCAPEEGRYAFTAHAPGSSECEDDDFEPNDSREQPTDIEFDAEGECAYAARKVCAGNVDWYRMIIPADHWAGAMLSFEPANGLLRMDLIDTDGSTVLMPGERDEGQIIVVSEILDETKTVYLRVQGETAGVANRYDLVALQREKCDGDDLEPNDYPTQARDVAEGEYTGLNSCGEPDWYKIELVEADELRVTLDFVHADGDLDLWVFDQATVDSAEVFNCDNSLACSITETNGEEVVVESIPTAGTYFIAMGPFQAARNTYSMQVVVNDSTTSCEDDDREENDAPAEAEAVYSAGSISGLTVCPDDDDWYATPMLAGETLVVDIFFIHAEGDLDLKLYSESVLQAPPEGIEQHRVAAAFTTDDNEHIEYPVPTASTLYTRVVGYESASNDYTLEMEFRSP